jgi:hypothetical protein
MFSYLSNILSNLTNIQKAVMRERYTRIRSKGTQNSINSLEKTPFAGISSTRKNKERKGAIES